MAADNAILQARGHGDLLLAARLIGDHTAAARLPGSDAVQQLAAGGVVRQKIAIEVGGHHLSAAVTAIPATMGVVIRLRHRTTPVSASTAVTQPNLSASLSPKPLAEPRNVFPSSNSGSLGSNFNVVHQSVLFT